MPQLKASVSIAEKYSIEAAARRQGKPTSEFMRRAAVAAAMGTSMVPMAEAAVDKEERQNHRAARTGAYLSGPLASAIQRISLESGNSQSSVMRDLIRCELRRRGLLPNGSHGCTEIST
jgi:hypothetical protein